MLFSIGHMIEAFKFSSEYF